MDFAEVARIYPQFGKSTWNLLRPRGLVFGSQGSSMECSEGCGRDESSLRRQQKIRGSWFDGSEMSYGARPIGLCHNRERAGCSGMRTVFHDDGPYEGGGCVPGSCYVNGTRKKGYLKSPNQVCNDENCEVCWDCQPTYGQAHSQPKCGPDVTEALIGKLREANKCRNRADALSFLSKLSEGGEWDWKHGPSREAMSIPECESGCDNTLCICGTCLDCSVPGNILYGYTLTACGWTSDVVFGFAKLFANSHGRPWPDWDRAAVAFGLQLLGHPYRFLEFCGYFNKVKRNMQLPGAPECRWASCCA